ncbi:hypothetical protein MTO96_047568 [Rhipicephalus appendiculatus]
MEEARPLGCISRYDAVKDRMYRLLYAAAGFSIVVLLSGLATTLLGWRLGTALTLTGFALLVACWVVFLCTCAERSRTFLVAIVPGYLLDSNSPEDDDRQRPLCDTRVEDILSAGDADDYKCN